MAELNVDDVTHHAKKYLTPEAVLVVDTVEKSRINGILIENDKPIAKTIYFSVTCYDEKLEEAIEKMSIVMNELVAKGHIHSILSPISRLRLASIDDLKLPYAVFFFPIVPMEAADEWEKHPYATKEGGIGPRL